MTSEVPRPEYPRPQFIRTTEDGSPDWQCLNGEWEFCIDPADSGLETGVPKKREWPDRIVVPFSPESELSGINHLDFMPAVWYRRSVTLPQSWAGRSIILNFQAVDYDTTVWAMVDSGVDDSANASPKMIEIGRHRGGFTPFACHLDRAKATGGDTVTLIVRARDPKTGPQPRGKQSTRYAPHGCLYTRTTGIWQTVWLEALPKPAALKRARITPDLAASAFRIEQPLTNNPSGYQVRIVVSDSDGVVTTATVRADLDLTPRLDLFLPEGRRRLWSIDDPFLYDLQIELIDESGLVVDRLRSYAGLRSVSIEGKKVKINGEAVFQRLILDQGYYPGGVMTAPTEEALIRDIQLSMDAGFNGARLHQKVFEERFLYHADRLGYLCWGEFGDWGCDGYGPSSDHQRPGVTYAAQFLEALERDYSHPAIIGWCPLNETHQVLTDEITVLDDATRSLFLACKAMDTTRPVLDTSGYSHRVFETDIYDSHDYITEEKFDEDGLVNFKAREGDSTQGVDTGWTAFINPQYPGPRPSTTVWSLPYNGQPYFCSEFGGFKWVHGSDSLAPAGDTTPAQTWGYGSSPSTREEFYHRFDAVCQILMGNPNMFGFCYTQLTDIFPEENGLYTFDRVSKFDPTRLRSILKRVAAIEAS